jgi:VanZ family protein
MDSHFRKLPFVFLVCCLPLLTSRGHNPPGYHNVNVILKLCISCGYVLLSLHITHIVDALTKRYQTKSLSSYFCMVVFICRKFIQHIPSPNTSTKNTHTFLTFEFGLLFFHISTENKNRKEKLLLLLFVSSILLHKIFNVVIQSFCKLINSYPWVKVLSLTRNPSTNYG